MRLLSSCLSDCFEPATADGLRLFHVDEEDRILRCPPDLGAGYQQEISLRDDVYLVILDYTLHQDVAVDYVGTGGLLEFEFNLNGPEANHSLIVPYFPTRTISVKKSQERFFKVEVFFRQPTLTYYLKQFIERLSPQTRDLVAQLLQQLYQYQNGGYSSSTTKLIRGSFQQKRQIPHVKQSQLISALTLEQVMAEQTSSFNHTDFFELTYATRCSITQSMGSLINDILACPYRGKNRRAYLEEKALKLVDLRLNAIQKLPDQNNHVNYVAKAASILSNNLIEPPPLETLAHQVGTNRSTLIQSFRKLQGVTPFGYLRTLRLIEARRLLMTSEMAIQDIAKSVGYRSCSRFATAFREQYGMNPKAFQLQTWKQAS